MLKHLDKINSIIEETVTEYYPHLIGKCRLEDIDDDCVNLCVDNITIYISKHYTPYIAKCDGVFLMFKNNAYIIYNGDGSVFSGEIIRLLLYIINWLKELSIKSKTITKIDEAIIKMNTIADDLFTNKFTPLVGNTSFYKEGNKVLIFKLCSKLIYIDIISDTVFSVCYNNKTYNIFNEKYNRVDTTEIRKLIKNIFKYLYGNSNLQKFYRSYKYFSYNNIETYFDNLAGYVCNNVSDIICDMTKYNYVQDPNTKLMFIDV